MKNEFLIISMCCLALLSCKNSGRTLTSATGTIYELLIVADNAEWNSQIGDTLRAIFDEPTPDLPQVEPYFNVSRVALSQFDDLLKPSRNILIVDVDSSKYTRTKIAYSKDHWSHPQAVARICCPNMQQLDSAVNNYGRSVRQFFVRQELERQAKFYESYCNHTAKDEILKKFDIELIVPNDMVKIQEDKDFYWVCDARGQARKDIVIYSYPYTDPNTFTLDYMLNKRDSILGKYVQGSMAGSHIATETKHIPPQLNIISVNDNFCAELRGLWKMVDGQAMGGPFVSHSKVDEINHKVITVECFVYAAGMKKRNTLRQMEAVLYTFKLPQEQNQLPTIEVKAK